MVTIQAIEGVEWSIEEQEYIMSCMYVSIMDYVNDVKAVTRCGGIQYLVVLLCNETSAKKIMDAIFKRFFKMCSENTVDIGMKIAEFQSK